MRKLDSPRLMMIFFTRGRNVDAAAAASGRHLKANFRKVSKTNLALKEIIPVSVRAENRRKILFHWKEYEEEEAACSCLDFVGGAGGGVRYFSLHLKRQSEFYSSNCCNQGGQPGVTF
jgi:hypothetical protein